MVEPHEEKFASTATLKDGFQRFPCPSCEYVTFAAMFLVTHVETEHKGQQLHSSWSNLKICDQSRNASGNFIVDSLQQYKPPRNEEKTINSSVADASIQFLKTETNSTEEVSFNSMVMDGDVSGKVLVKAEALSEIQEESGVDCGFDEAGNLVKKEFFDCKEEAVEKDGVDDIEVTESFDGDEEFLKTEERVGDENVKAENDKNEIRSDDVLKSEEVDLGVDTIRCGFQCRKCDYQNLHGTAFITHFESHILNSDLLNDCQQEVGVFLENCRLKVVEGSTKYRCRFCSYRGTSEDSWKRHMIINHFLPYKQSSDRNTKENTINFRCDMCPFTAEVANNLVIHEFIVHTPFVDGEGVTTTPDNYKNRQRKAKWFECQYCEFKCKQSSELKKHIGNVHKEDVKMHQCEHCLYKNQDEKNLQWHMCHKHILPKKIEWFECEHCSFKSMIKQNLRKHARRKHTSTNEIKWFECENCIYKSKSKCALQRHNVYKHTLPEEINWYLCEHCAFRTKFDKTLKQHILHKHTPDERLIYHKCSECSYKTIRRDNLRTHVLTKHTSDDAIKWFQCADCPYKAKLKVCLREHVRKHNRMELKCEQCSYKTLRTDLMRKHAAKKHNIRKTRRLLIK